MICGKNLARPVRSYHSGTSVQCFLLLGLTQDPFSDKSYILLLDKVDQRIFPWPILLTKEEGGLNSISVFYD